MILLQDTLVKQSSFWTGHYDFYVFLFLGILGIFISYFSYREAEKAKIEAEAAKEAASETQQSIKMKESSIDIAKIIDSCALNEKVKYFDAVTHINNEIVRKINYILMVHQNEIETIQPGFVQQIKENVKAITNALDTVNPINSTEGGEDIVFSTVTPNFSDLIGSLSSLQAILDKQLIKK